jgi:hypothetical protein
VVAVPDWWTTGETRCFAPVEDTVYFDMGGIADCSDAPRAAQVQEVSALAVLDGTSGYGEQQLRDMRPVATVDGREVVELDGCEQWYEVCRRLFAVPSEGVVFAVTIAEEGDGDYQEIRDSVRIVPTTHTVVPLAGTDGWTPTWGAEPSAVRALTAALENAGLRFVIKKLDPSDGRGMGLVADLPAGSLLDVEPQLGSVIANGGTVTLTVMGEVTRPTENPSSAPPTGSTGSGRPFKMYTHCGVESARIDGRWWHASPPLYDKSQIGPPAGWGDPFQNGTLTVKSAHRAVFEALGQQVVFVPAPNNEPVRICR